MSKVKLSVIMPVFNEAATVGVVLKKLVKQTSVKEVLVIDDGSTDSSGKIIKKIKNPKIKYYCKQNGGKGSAIRYALPLVSQDFVLIQDADLEYDPDDIAVLIAPIAKEKVTVVYGSRFLGPHLNLLFWHRVGNHFLNFVINVLYNTTLSDMETCYKVLPTAVLRDLNLQSSSFEIEPEITCKLLKRNIKIYEVPISYFGRDFSEGKKISWRDGFTALHTIMKERFFEEMRA
jgi:glycosyltransferase involved in cell wall biosynthesis